MPRNPLTKSGPISPKAHGAWLGAGTGVAIANVIIGLIEAYWTHRPLPTAAVDGINLVATPLVAFLGAWLAPLISKVMQGGNPTINQITAAAATLGMEVVPKIRPVQAPPQASPPSP